jgi:hypothetical protein
MPIMMRHANMGALLAGERPIRKALPQLFPSLPGLTRQSISFAKLFTKGDGCAGQARA